MENYYCNRCKEEIEFKEYNFCIEHEFKPLCRPHQPTSSALKLGELLRKKGHKVEFEKDDGYKHIDIAIVNKKVNIEVDGIHHQTKEQALRDLKRTFYSWDKNFVTLRIPNSLAKYDTIEETAEYIDKFLNTERNKLKKEVEEDNLIDNPFLREVNNKVNEFVGKANKMLNNLSKTFKL